MDNPAALNASELAFEQEIGNRLAGHRHRHTMQVQFRAHHEHTAPEFLQDSLLQTGTEKNEFFPRLHIDGLKMLG